MRCPGCLLGRGTAQGPWRPWAQRALSLFNLRTAAHLRERQPTLNQKCLNAEPCNQDAVFRKTAFSHRQRRCAGGQRGPCGCGEGIWRALLLRPAPATLGHTRGCSGSRQGGRTKGSRQLGARGGRLFPRGPAGPATCISCCRRHVPRPRPAGGDVVRKGTRAPPSRPRPGTDRLSGGWRRWGAHTRNEQERQQTSHRTGLSGRLRAPPRCRWGAPTRFEAQLVVLLPLVVIQRADPHLHARARGGVLVERVGVPVGVRGGERVVGLVVRPVGGVALRLLEAAHAARKRGRGPERGAPGAGGPGLGRAAPRGAAWHRCAVGPPAGPAPAPAEARCPVPRP